MAAHSPRNLSNLALRATGAYASAGSYYYSLDVQDVVTVSVAEFLDITVAAMWADAVVTGTGNDGTLGLGPQT